MLKRKLCQAVITWKSECEGPLLIADGNYQQRLDEWRAQEKKKNESQEAKDQKPLPDKLFISRDNPDDVWRAISRGQSRRPPELTFYVPGTSLRGPFRSQAELIIRSLLPEQAAPGVTACDPFEQDKENQRKTLSCSKRLEEESAKYAAACPACRLFGCAGLASRITFDDANIAQYHSVYRDMIGIDRFTGGVYSGANMRFHVLENACFETKITLTNFELWQLGLLAYVFQDFADGLVSIGFGKTKGFGQVKGTVCRIQLIYPTGKSESKIQHLSTLFNSEQEKKYYALDDAPPLDFSDHLQLDPHSGISLYETFSVTNIDAFWGKVAPSFNTFIDRRMADLQ